MIRSRIHAQPDSEHRFSERSFRRFEPDLLEVCKHYPKVVVIHPRGVHVETYRARVKDAMRAFVNSTWDSLVDRNKVNFILNNFAIIIREGNLLFGPVGSDLRATDSVVSTLDQSKSLSIQIDASDARELSAALYLAERDKLPLEVELINITEEEVQQLEESRPSIRIGARDGKFYLI